MDQDTGQPIGQDRTPDNGPSVLSVREAADRAGVSDKTILRAVRSNRLPASKQSGAYEIDLETFTRWLIDRNAAQPAASSTRQDAGQDRTEDRTPPVSDVSSVVEELRRLLESERAERQDAQHRVEQLSGQVGYWQGQAEAFRSQLMALSAGDNETHEHDVTRASERPLEAAERGETDDQTSAGEAGQESRLRSWWDWIKRH